MDASRGGVTDLGSTRRLGTAGAGAGSRGGASKPVPEVHFLGEVVGATGFGDRSICAKFSIEAGDKWEWLEGARSGQTQTAAPDYGSDLALWSHPLDLHFSAGSIHGWPRVQVQVWEQDSYGRLESLGYGFAHIPAATGSHDIRIPVWRPVGSASDEFTSFFLGGNPALKSTSVVYANASDRVRLTTMSAGTVHVTLDVLFRYMDAYGVEW